MYYDKFVKIRLLALAAGDDSLVQVCISLALLGQSGIAPVFEFRPEAYGMLLLC